MRAQDPRHRQTKNINKIKITSSTAQRQRVGCRRIETKSVHDSFRVAVGDVKITWTRSSIIMHKSHLVCLWRSPQCTLHHTSDHRECDCMSYELVFDIFLLLGRKQDGGEKRENERELKMGIQRIGHNCYGGDRRFTWILMYCCLCVVWSLDRNK